MGSEMCIRDRTQAGGGEFDDLDLINEVMAGVLGAHDQRMIELGLEP